MYWNEPNAQEAGYYTDETDLGAPTYRDFYDGQMMQEDDKTIPNMMGSPTISGNSYALGARGVDRISLSMSSTFTEHMIAELFDGS